MLVSLVFFFFFLVRGGLFLTLFCDTFFCKFDQVNIVKGLKLYKDILTDSELSKLSEFVNELRLAGQRGDLSGILNDLIAMHFVII